MTAVKIALGSNIGDPARNIARAVDEMAKLGTISARSSLYLTKPWGYAEQPDFLNAVIELTTTLAPHELLSRLKGIEKAMGRQQTIPWGPRLIDLDILTYGNVSLDEPGLSIPHPRMNERAFVLVPLAEIDADYTAACEALPAKSLAEVKRTGPLSSNPGGSEV